MPDSFLHHAPASGIIRLKTLIRMRWLAIIGQSAALVPGLGFFYLSPAAPLLIIAASVLFNLYAMRQARQWPTLRNRGATVSLAFDTVQLALLLHVTGGLSNPFSVMMLVPMVVAATLLAGRSVIFLTALGIACLTGLLFFSAPLVWPRGLSLPHPVFTAGVYGALVVSALFLVLYVRKVARESRRLSEALGASRLALEREQKISAFGALAAAVAHELGSPLSTIAVIAGDMAHDAKSAEQAEDMQLLLDQVARCRKILSDLGRHNIVADQALEQLPLAAWIRKIADPYQRDGILFECVVTRSEGTEPVWPMQPALIHGIANPLQNAFHFARGVVRVELDWQGAHVCIRIMDDGPGFPPQILARLGNAYVSGRTGADHAGHMGLGLFIAATLLQRSGATIAFANRTYSDGNVQGANVTMEWLCPPV